MIFRRVQLYRVTPRNKRVKGKVFTPNISKFDCQTIAKPKDHITIWIRNSSNSKEN